MKIFKSSKTAAVALMFVIFGFSQAEANSRFTIKNDSSAKILVYVFNGDDKICIAEVRKHKVEVGSERDMGCAGGGEHRCKVRIEKKFETGGYGGAKCTNLNNGCSGIALILDNHSSLEVQDDTCSRY